MWSNVMITSGKHDDPNIKRPDFIDNRRNPVIYIILRTAAYASIQYFRDAWFALRPSHMGSSLTSNIIKIITSAYA